MKKIIYSILLLLLTISLIFPSTVQGYTQDIVLADADGGDTVTGGGGSADGFTLDSIKEQADTWLNGGKGQDHINDQQLQNIIIPIGQMLVAIGSVILVIVTTIMGIKYIMGGPDKRAQLKQQLVGLVVATIVIFAAQAIWALVYNFMTDLTVSKKVERTPMKQEIQLPEEIWKG